MRSLDLHEYMQAMRERQIIKSRYTLFRDSLTWYINDARVDKVMLIVDIYAMKNAKKVGLHEPYTLMKTNLPQNKHIIPKEITKGLFMIQYIFKNQIFNVYPWESKVFL